MLPLLGIVLLVLVVWILAGFRIAQEYERDLAKGIAINVPINYYPNDDPTSKPNNRWRSHAHLLFSNWLNYYVYQQTPFKWE